MPRGRSVSASRRLLVVAGFLSAALAGAQQVSLSVSTTAGVFIGGATEVVLSQGYKVSELDWPLLPVFTMGANLDVATKAGFRAALEVQRGLPGYDGIMTDSDFLNGDGVKTHFSQSNGYSEGITALDARLGWSFDIDTGGSRPGADLPVSRVSVPAIQVERA